MKNLSVSVIVPCYNEADVIAGTIEKIDAFFRKKNLKGEIIIVDDGSTDETSKKAAESKTQLPIKILRQKNKGKGASVKKGVLNSKSDLILFTDADLSTDISELDKFIPDIQKGFDIIIASRDMPESKLCPAQPIFRRFIGYLCKLFVRIIVMQGFHDTQCGFKLFTVTSAKKIFPLLKTKGFAFDIEVLYLAKKLGFKVKEVGVIWRNSPNSRVNPVIDPLKFFVQIFLIKLRIILREYRSKKSREL
jgi:dolichyl-phosphate beta-glucosyltransferase